MTQQGSTTQRAHLLLPDSRHPSKNLGHEEFLFQQNWPYTVLFLYTNNPSVIIGKNQNPWVETNMPWLLESEYPLVRRISGGGTVWHDQGNLNYSFSGPSSLINKEENLLFISEVIRSFSIENKITDRGDILADSRKFSGNALCHKAGRTLHHGTILVESNLTNLRSALDTSWNENLRLSSSAVKSVRSSVCQLSGIRPGLTIKDVAEAILDEWMKIGPSTDLSGFSDEGDPKRVYDDRDWNYGRTPAFEVDSPKGRVAVVDGKMPDGTNFNEYLGFPG